MEIINTSSDAATMAGVSSGKVTFQNTFTRLAPRL
ncbi:Uncharacterised protein [Mycobacteroides abscessus subsp. abscessus]|nr:Uncharacterised protein [Mycobacteroides abscessus subsp. abscessus]